MSRPSPSAASMSSLLRSYAASHGFWQAKQAHTHALVHGLLPNVTLETDLLLVYAKCGIFNYARKVFDRMRERSMHSWNILIASYANGSLYDEALALFKQFCRMGLRADHFTLPPVIKASAGMRDFYLCRTLHGWVIKMGLEEYLVVSTSLLDFYSKSGDLILAQRVFHKLPSRDSGVWNTIISGFGKAGLHMGALHYFKNMLSEGVKIDCRTISSILNACGREGDLRRGKELHGQVVKCTLFDRDIVIGNALIDMYAKCGSLHDSENVFSSMHELNVVSWTTMISSHGIHGKGEESLLLFKQMMDSGHKPNCVTITAVLASCSHSGLIHQGRKIFDSISSDYGFEPCVEHYACIIDLLGRFGHLEEAFGLIKKKGLPPVASIWGALLAGCARHKNVDIGEIAAYLLFELEPANPSNYVALYSIYESLHIKDGATRMRTKMRDLGLTKIPGSSWITVFGRLYRFYQGDLTYEFIWPICEGLDVIVKESLP